MTEGRTRTSASSQPGLTALSRIPTSMEIWFAGKNGHIYGSCWYENEKWVTYPFPSKETADKNTVTPETGLTALSRKSDTMEVWWVAPDGAVKGAFWYEHQKEWTPYEIAGKGSAVPGGHIVALSRKSNALEIWWITPEGAVRGADWYEGQTKWNAYPKISADKTADTSGRIAAVSRKEDTMEIWWVAPDGNVKGADWYESTKKWNTYEIPAVNNSSH